MEIKKIPDPSFPCEILANPFNLICLNLVDLEKKKLVHKYLIQRSGGHPFPYIKIRNLKVSESLIGVAVKIIWMFSGQL